MPAAVLALTLVLAGRAWADDSPGPWGLRASGGYGFSLDKGSPVEVNGLDLRPGGFHAPASGMDAGLEVACALHGGLQFSLGLFPVFIAQSVVVSLPILGEYRETISGTLVPVLANVYLDYALGSSLAFIAGAGAGLAPAATLLRSNPNGYGPSDLAALDAGLALRGVLGLDWACRPACHLGFLVQGLLLDQAVGGTGLGNDMNQIAPMLYAEYRP